MLNLKYQSLNREKITVPHCDLNIKGMYQKVIKISYLNTMSLVKYGHVYLTFDVAIITIHLCNNYVFFYLFSIS